MRAITGAIVSSKPCSLVKAFHILDIFYNSDASDLLSADCAAYISTATEAIREHEFFRRELRGNQQQGAANLEAHDYEGEMKHQDRERKGDIAGSQSQRDSAAEVEPDVAAGEKKSKKKKNKEDRLHGGAVAGVESHIPSSPEINREKRKKEKHSVKEVIVNVKQEPDLVADEELLSEKKNKKKKEKVRIKLEEAGDVDKVGGKIVKDGGSQQNVASGEKKRKKKKHEAEEVNYKDVKQEEKMVCDGDLDSEKKRKKKRGRGDNDDNALEQVEHTKKKQRK
ncbi:unnamed protein product [Urochloa decumbens]|uniref:Uncharacterized protein n=1 Tax=Urochloa decumbens TaxID=240449 RepID=A0ABC8YWT4_9POAL